MTSQLGSCGSEPEVGTIKGCKNVRDDVVRDEEAIRIAEPEPLAAIEGGNEPFRHVLLQGGSHDGSCRISEIISKHLKMEAVRQSQSQHDGVEQALLCALDPDICTCRP